jgi:hypothetical protein
MEKTMKKALSLFLLLSTFLWACSGSDSGGGGAGASQPGFTVSADGEEIETLNITTDSPARLEVKTSGLPGGMTVEITDNGGVFAGLAPQFTGSDGVAVFTVSTDINFLEEVSGELLLTADNDGEIISLAVPYTVAAWDRNLWGGEAEMNASGLIARSTPFEAPNGLSIQSVALISGDTVGLQLNVVDGVLEVTAEDSVSDGVREIVVYIEGVDEPLPVTFQVVKGNGSGLRPYPIRSAEEFALITCNDGSVSFFLDGDIELPDSDTWSPICAGATDFSTYTPNPFKGKLDGRGHSITAKEAIFFEIDGAEIYDINIYFNTNNYYWKNIPYSGVYYYSGVLAYTISDSRVSNITLSGVSSPGFGGSGTYECTNSAGILAGTISGGYFTDISIDAELNVSAARYVCAGMLAGEIIDSPAELKGIAVSGKIDIISTHTIYTGSVAGRIASGGSVRLSYGKAGIVCNGDGYAGGIAGALTNTVVDSVYYNGEINCDGANAVGGIASWADGLGGEIKNSYTLGKLTVSYSGGGNLQGEAGGIVAAANYAGYSWNNLNNPIGDPGVPITNCYSAMDINAARYAGGIEGITALPPSSPHSNSAIQKNIALNKIVNAQYSARIANNNVNGAYNFAYTDMSLDGNLADASTKGHNTANGTDILPSDITAPYFLSDLGFAGNIWDLDFTNRSYKLPILKGVGGDQKNFIMPEY